jgi:hypothetical protein
MKNQYAAALKTIGVALTTALASATLAGCAGTPQQVTCGAHLTASTTLTTDLFCPQGNGLTLDRAITLNLGGHRLIGPGAGTARSTGVTLAPGGGSIVNGQLQGWETAVSGDSFGFDTMGRAQLTQLTVTGNGTGASVAGMKLTVSKSKFLHNSGGVFGFFAQIDIHESAFLGDGASDGGAWYLTIDRSVLDGTGSTEASATCSESGLTITNSVVKNYALPAGGWDCGGAVLTGNTFSGNKVGFRSTHDLETPPNASAPGERIVNNTFTGNGIGVDSGVSGRIAGNTFSANQTGLITTGLLSLSVSENTFSHNKSSGLHATSAPGVAIGRNVATHNGRYGIYAPHATDAGGNVAVGNGAAPQCVGVRCATS